MLLENEDRRYEGFEDHIQIDCPDCEGKGVYMDFVLDEWLDCWTCEGRGVIPQDEARERGLL